MTTIRAYLHGIHPRSEALVEATRDLERGRTTAEAVASRVDADREALVGAQQAAWLDAFSDGLLRWQDLFRPMVEESPGMRAGGLVRWFDNNEFYRAPELTGPLDSPAPAEMDDLATLPSPRVATLPSPYLFSRAAHGEADPDALCVQIARDVLRPAALRCADLGATIVHLEEPWLVARGIAEASWKPFGEALEALRDGLSAELVLHTYYGDAAPHVSRLRELPVDALGVDLFETDVDALGVAWDKGLVAGCVSGRASRLEPVETIVALVARLAETLGPPSITVTSAGDLALLPRELAERKVALIGAAAKGAREVLA